jgi:hypothetical protein
MDVNMQLTVLLEHLRQKNFYARWPYDIADKVCHLNALNKSGAALRLQPRRYAADKSSVQIIISARVKFVEKIRTN